MNLAHHTGSRRARTSGRGARTLKQAGGRARTGVGAGRTIDSFSWRQFVIGGDPVALARHRAEYAEPTVWLWRRIVGAAFAFIVVAGAWYLVKIPDGLFSDDALPSQTAVAAALNEVRSDGFAGSTLAGHAGISLFRLTFGLGLGAMVGVALGLGIGGAPLLRTVVDPISSFFRMVPGLAVAPIALIWFGAGEVTIVLVVAQSVMWTSLSAVTDARSRSLRLGTSDLPHQFIAGMRSALLTAWITVLAMETVLADSGLGAMIWWAQARSDVILVGVYVAGVIGFALDTLLRGAEYLVHVAEQPAKSSPTGS